jgi:hypothetical protein
MHASKICCLMDSLKVFKSFENDILIELFFKNPSHNNIM